MAVADYLALQMETVMDEALKQEQSSPVRPRQGAIKSRVSLPILGGQPRTEVPDLLGMQRPH